VKSFLKLLQDYIPITSVKFLSKPF